MLVWCVLTCIALADLRDCVASQVFAWVRCFVWILFDFVVLSLGI